MSNIELTPNVVLDSDYMKVIEYTILHTFDQQSVRATDDQETTDDIDDVGLRYVLGNLPWHEVPKDLSQADQLRIVKPIESGFVSGVSFGNALLKYSGNKSRFHKRLYYELSSLDTGLASSTIGLNTRLKDGSAIFLDKFRLPITQYLQSYEPDELRSQSNRVYLSSFGYIATIAHTMLIEHYLRKSNTDKLTHLQLRDNDKAMSRVKGSIALIEEIAYEDCDPRAPDYIE